MTIPKAKTWMLLAVLPCSLHFAYCPSLHEAFAQPGPCLLAKLRGAEENRQTKRRSLQNSGVLRSEWFPRKTAGIALHPSPWRHQEDGIEAAQC